MIPAACARLAERPRILYIELEEIAMAAAEDWPVRRKGDRERVAERVRRLQELVRNLPAPPPSVDEFIAEKRREARREH